MFTGIVEEVGTVRSIKQTGEGLNITIGCSFAAETHIDESISVEGVCQTVITHDEDTFTVQCIEETLRKTTLGRLANGDPVNLERSLTLQKGIEGHLVQGHVDTTGTIKKIQQDENDRLYTVSYSDDYIDLIVGRGSITIDGISLTVARESGHTFTVAIIPYTYRHTSLKLKKEGDAVNLEFDVLGKYVVKYLNNRMKGKADSNITKEWLAEMGFK